MKLGIGWISLFMVAIIAGCNGQDDSQNIQNQDDSQNIQNQDDSQNTQNQDDSQNTQNQDDSQKSKDRAELNNNRETWSESGIVSYRYEYQKSCYCLPQEDMVVLVEDGAVTEAFYTPSGVYLTEQELEQALTIDELFDLVEQAINDNVASLSVSYHSDFGYPERVSIDFDKLIADDEITHFAADLSR